MKKIAILKKMKNNKYINIKILKKKNSMTKR